MATARRSRLAARTAIGLGIVGVLVLAVVVVIALAKPSVLANRIAQQELPKISQQLGRPVTVAGVQVGWFPVRAVIRDLRVGGASGEPDLLDASRVSVRPKLWKLIVSRGHDIQIASIHIEAPQVNLVRLPDGSFDLPEGQSKSSAPAPNGSREISLGRITLDHGSVRLYAAGAKGEPLVALTQIHSSAGPLAIGAPLNLELDAALGAERQNLRAKLQLTPLPADLADARAHPPKIEGKLVFAHAQLDKFRELLPASAQGLIQGGLLTADAQVSGSQRLALSGSASLEQASLRGKPASGSFKWKAQLAPANLSSAEVQIENLRVRGPGVELQGTASGSLAQKRAQFAITGPLLDLDSLLAALPQSPKQPSKTGGMSSQVRSELEQVAIAGSLSVKKVIVHKLQATDLEAAVQLRGGKLVLSRTRASLYGGALDADNAEIDLARPRPAWRLRANLSGVDLGQALQATSGEHALDGRTSGTIDLAGEGSDWSQLRQNLTGNGALLLAQAALRSGTLGAQLANPIRSVLPGAAGKSAAAVAQGTPLKNLGLGFSVRNGWMQLNRPLAFDADFGSATLNGRIGLDGRLDLSGKVALAPSFVSSIAGKAFSPSQPVEIPVKLGGTLAHPSLEPAVSGPALASLFVGQGAGKALQGARNTAQNAAQNAEKNVANQAQKGLGHILGH